MLEFCFILDMLFERGDILLGYEETRGLQVIVQMYKLAISLKMWGYGVRFLVSCTDFIQWQSVLLLSRLQPSSLTS